MFARNVLLAFALCAMSTVFAAPISVSTTTSSATITSNTQLLSRTTAASETASATANEQDVWGLGPISRDVDDEGMPVVRPPTPRSLINLGSPGVEPVDRGAKQLDQMHKALDQMHKQLDEMHRQMNKGVWPDQGAGAGQTNQRPGNTAVHVNNPPHAATPPPVVNKGLALSPLGPMGHQPDEEPDHIEPPPPGPPGEQHDADWYDEEKRDLVPELLSETDLEGVVSDAGLGAVLGNLSPEQLVAVLSELSPEELRTILSNEAVASLLSKADLDNLLGAAPTTSSADKEAAAASAVASALASP